MNLFDQKVANSICRAELDRFRQDYPTYLDVVDRDVLAWAANEVERQGDGPLHVVNMIDAYNYANRYMALPKDHVITVKDILVLGYLVDRNDNAGGFRTHNVYVGWINNMKLDWQKIPRSLQLLVESQDAMTATAWYREFEEIHPPLPQRRSSYESGFWRSP